MKELHTISDPVCTHLNNDSRYEQLRYALDQHAIVSATDEHGIIVEANNKFCAISGYSREELIGQNHRLVKSGIHPDKVYQELWATIASGKIWQGTVCNRSKSGQFYWVEATIVPILNEQGKPWRYVSIRTDITDLKQKQESLIIARDAAEAASRAKSLFLANMTHELRTPLNAIIGFGQLLEIDHGLAPDQADSLHEILKAGRHLMALIEEILDLSRIETGQLVLGHMDVCIDAVLEESLALVRQQAAKHAISFAVSLPGDCMVLADSNRLKQVLVNLLSNAIKYNRPNGQVLISLERGERNQIRLHVVDTGIGIPVERINELFQPFQRLGQELGSVEGTGVGLSISKQLIETMGGSIGVISTPGKGSDFWIELPLAKDSGSV